MGTLYGSNITPQNFGQHVLTKNVIFCDILFKNSLKMAKNRRWGKWVGGLCYDVWDAHIGVKQGPKVVFDPSKNEINVTIILFSGSIFEIW